MLVSLDAARCDLERGELKLCFLSVQTHASSGHAQPALLLFVATTDQERRRPPVLFRVLTKLREQCSASALHCLLVLVNKRRNASVKAIVSSDALSPFAPRTPAQSRVVARLAQR